MTQQCKNQQNPDVTCEDANLNQSEQIPAEKLISFVCFGVNVFIMFCLSMILNWGGKKHTKAH